jgi:hypothetical protein
MNISYINHRPTPRAADKSGDGSSYGDSALNGFFVLSVLPVKVPLLPLTPAVGRAGNFVGKYSYSLVTTLEQPKNVRMA